MSKANLVHNYMETIHSILRKVEKEEEDSISRAGELVANSIENLKPVHVIGTGHAQILAVEIFNRAGELNVYNSLLDLGLSVPNSAAKASGFEKLLGYAKVLFDYYGLKKGETIIVISTSGINAVPIEMAMQAKETDLKVIAITSKGWSSNVPPRHPSGKRLYELGDIVIDNHVPMGDAVVAIPGLKQKASPISTIVVVAILHSISLRAIEILLERGITPPVRTSLNVPWGREFNRKLREKYPEFYRFKHR